MRTNRILPPTYLFLSVVAMGVLHFLAPVAAIVTSPWNFLGAVPLAAGIWLNLAADADLKKFNTTVKPFEKSSALVTSGVYRISRHPMYLGMVLILFGIGLILGSMTPFFVILVFGVLMERVFIVTEERMMAETFGDEWQSYRWSVRRWI